MQSKDLNIVMETAKEYGIPLPSCAIDQQLYQSMLQNNLGNLDNSAIISVFENLANEKLKTYSD
jgi:2-hydroxy-3-oxopropionate reductase